MSLLLVIFYYVGIPALILFAAQFFLGKTHSTLSRSLVAFASLAIGLGYFWWVFGEKLWVDHQVRELCAKDGGVKVYETISLPADKFNQYGQINFFRPIDGENALGPDYIYIWRYKYLKKGDPSLSRSHTVIIRRSDNKLLGESISYSRGGGDPVGPWQPTSFSCPSNYGQVQLLEKIFLKVPAGG